MTDYRVTDRMITVAENWYNQISAQNVTDSSQKEFKKWFEQDPAHQQAYAQIYICHEENFSCPPADMAEMSNINVETANDQPTVKRYSSFMKYGAIAAVLLVAFLTFNIYREVPETIEYSTQIAEIREILLEDGSMITLGASSRISVAEFTSDERRVFLEEGEALFDIAHDTQKPFIVKSGKTEIQVLGTRFNLNRTVDYLAVSLLEGKIEVHQEITSSIVPFLREEETVTLYAAQIIRVKNGILNYPESRKTSQMASWVRGKLSYFNAPLSVVISDINRYSLSPVTIKDKSLENLPVTAVFGTDQIDIMVKGLSQILPIVITQGEDGSYIIRSKKMGGDI